MKKIRFIICLLIFTLLFSGMTYGQSEKPDSLSAKACIVMDAATGTVLFGRNEDQKLSMASTTKIMTTLLVLENADLQQEIVTTKEMVTVAGTSMGLLEGDKVTFEALCYGMMLPSGNDAANTAAIALAGSTKAFADMMNEKAVKIGMRNTHFVTPSGLDDDLHYSTAYDMALLASYALQNEQFRTIASSPSVSISYGNPPYRRTLKNHNKLLDSYEGCIGLKTGFTKKSGRCLVSAAQKDSSTLVCVTLSAPDDWNDHAKLLDYGFSQMEEVHAPAGQITLPVTGGVLGAVSGSYDAFTVSVPASRRKEITFSSEVYPFCYAPITAGQVIGRRVAQLDNILLASIPIVADAAVGSVPYHPSLWQRWLEKLGLLLIP